MPRKKQETTQAQTRSRGSVDEPRPSLGPAIISGGCAVAVALITGVFNWVNRPSPEPAAPTPTLRVERNVREPVRTASLETPTSPAPLQRRGSEPKYGLNFAAFQLVVKDSSVTEEVRRKVIDKVVGHTVIWKGYVDSVARHKPNQDGDIATVTLVESPIVSGQAMFKAPAICRFQEGEEQPLSDIKQGDSVTVSGLCSEHSALGTFVRNCHLLGSDQSQGGSIVR